MKFVRESKFPFFTTQELACPRTGLILATEEFESWMWDVVDVRRDLDFAFPVTSGYRSPAYNNEISSTGLNGPHTRGALDIWLTHQQAALLIREAVMRGWGIGIRAHGNRKKRFVHIDPGPYRIWTYS